MAPRLRQRMTGAVEPAARRPQQNCVQHAQVDRLPRYLVPQRIVDRRRAAADPTTASWTKPHSTAADPTAAMPAEGAGEPRTRDCRRRSALAEAISATSLGSQASRVPTSRPSFLHLGLDSIVALSVVQAARRTGDCAAGDGLMVECDQLSANSPRRSTPMPRMPSPANVRSRGRRSDPGAAQRPLALRVRRAAAARADRSHPAARHRSAAKALDAPHWPASSTDTRCCDARLDRDRDGACSTVANGDDPPVEVRVSRRSGQAVVAAHDRSGAMDSLDPERAESTVGRRCGCDAHGRARACLLLDGARAWRWTRRRGGSMLERTSPPALHALAAGRSPARGARAHQLPAAGQRLLAERARAAGHRGVLGRRAGRATDPPWGTRRVRGRSRDRAGDSARSGIGDLRAPRPDCPAAGDGGVPMGRPARLPRPSADGDRAGGGDAARPLRRRCWRWRRTAAPARWCRARARPRPIPATRWDC